MPLSQTELETATNKLIAAHAEAEKRNEWTFFVDELYAENCVYICEYGGAMNVTSTGRDEIKATHYGRDMLVGWEGWTFPYKGFYIGEEGKIITHWMNRGPGKREDGSFYETHGVSYIQFDDNAQICSQLDMFDICHQMHLCDELEAAGLLSEQLKAEWVIPMKAKIIAMLENK